jgi:hypothetical protein
VLPLSLLQLLAEVLQLLLLLEDVLPLVLLAVSNKKALQILVELLPFHDAFHRLLKGPKRKSRVFDKLARPSPIVGASSETSAFIRCDGQPRVVQEAFKAGWLVKEASLANVTLHRR